jgi:hypothetical protein
VNVNAWETEFCPSEGQAEASNLTIQLFTLQHYKKKEISLAMNDFGWLSPERRKHDFGQSDFFVPFNSLKT